ncbi:DgyrCDS12670 [Dimorphilus gyrociliatus]|uniref:DgyrCDS12670 n=1 Tax=Dimorphilus gyrociliatus TaxID=2664684 RepID=A0A7I8W890_9ANNE|nr:DgyrCDS12670 [Dimorphilus gyrociliatus]
MSSQKGNLKKSGPPKHQNKTAFKNSMHDTSKKTKELNSMSISGCCKKCQEILEWRIKYKKYKPLTQPKKCVRCNEKTVKRAYFISCDKCIKEREECGKCGKNKEDLSLPEESSQEASRQESELHQELRNLTERQRRSFFRNEEKGNFKEEICSKSTIDH